MEDDITSINNDEANILSILDDYIDELTVSSGSLYKILRLLCLHCIVFGGITESKRLDLIRKSLLDVYGYEYMFLLLNLERLGILSTPDLFYHTNT